MAETNSAAVSEGLEKLNQKQYDILITDHAMKPLSGLEVVEKIKQEPSYKKPSITAVCSAHLSLEMQEQYRSLGVSDFLDKPMKLEEMIQWLEAQIPFILKQRRV